MAERTPAPPAVPGGGIRRRWFCWVIGALALTAAAFGVARLTHPLIPSYGGRTLYEWIDLHAQAGKLPAARWETNRWATDFIESRRALDALSSRAVPVLLTDLDARRPRWFESLATDIGRRFRLGLFPLEPIERRWERAVTGLGFLGPALTSALPDLVARATNNPPWTLAALVATGRPALPAITNLLATASPPIVETLLEILRRGYPLEDASPEDASALVPALLSAAKSTNWMTRAYAAESLLQLRQRPDLCLPHFVEKLRSTDHVERSTAVMALILFRTNAVDRLPQLVRLAETESPAIRVDVLRAIRCFEDPSGEVLRALLRAADDPDFSVRRAAISFLAHTQGPVGMRMAAVVAHTYDPSPAVRSTTYRALGEFGTNASAFASVLGPIAEDPEDEDQAVARHALRLILGQPAGIPPRRLRRREAASTEGTTAAPAAEAGRR